MKRHRQYAVIARENTETWEPCCIERIIADDEDEALKKYGKTVLHITDNELCLLIQLKLAHTVHYSASNLTMIERIKEKVVRRKNLGETEGWQERLLDCLKAEKEKLAPKKGALQPELPFWQQKLLQHSKTEQIERGDDEYDYNK